MAGSLFHEPVFLHVVKSMPNLLVGSVFLRRRCWDWTRPEANLILLKVMMTFLGLRFQMNICCSQESLRWGVGFLRFPFVLEKILLASKGKTAINIFLVSRTIAFAFLRELRNASVLRFVLLSLMTSDFALS